MPLRTPLIVVCLSFAACGGKSSDSGNPSPRPSEPARQSATPFGDSIRARRNASLAVRPDTLGMRADSGRIAGDTTAKLWVIVLSDFQCAECRDLALRTLPLLRKEFVEKGLLRIAFVNHPQERHFNARFAALAALCAATAGRFWEMHDSLFAAQAYWHRMPDPRPYMDSLAVAAGVPAAVQSDCTSRNRMLHTLATDIERSRELEVADVPAVFVGDRRLEQGELTPGGLQRAVRSALAGR